MFTELGETMNTQGLTGHNTYLDRSGRVNHLEFRPLEKEQGIEYYRILIDNEYSGTISKHNDIILAAVPVGYTDSLAQSLIDQFLPDNEFYVIYPDWRSATFNKFRTVKAYKTTWTVWHDFQEALNE